ncbi:unnamed protein product [Prunus armeniaca]
MGAYPDLGKALAERQGSIGDLCEHSPLRQARGLAGPCGAGSSTRMTQQVVELGLPGLTKLRIARVGVL